MKNVSRVILAGLAVFATLEAAYALEFETLVCQEIFDDGSSSLTKVHYNLDEGIGYVGGLSYELLVSDDYLMLAAPDIVSVMVIDRDKLTFTSTSMWPATDWDKHPLENDLRAYGTCMSV